MKKAISILCVTVLLLSTLMISVYAADISEIADMEVQLNSYQMSLYRLEGKIKGQSEKEVAVQILKEAGLSERLIRALNDESLAKIYASGKMMKSEKYVHIQENGTIEYLSKEEYEGTLQEPILAETVGTNDIGKPKSREDAYTTISVIVFKSADDPTSYLYLTTNVWKKCPAFRGADFHILKATEGSVISDTMAGAFAYTKTYYGTGARTDEITEEYTYEDTAHCKSESRIVSVQCNLEKDFILATNGQTIGWKYDNFESIVLVQARQQKGTMGLPFNVTAIYEHEKIAIIGEASISLTETNYTLRASYAYDSLSVDTDIWHVA